MALRTLFIVFLLIGVVFSQPSAPVYPGSNDILSSSLTPTPSSSNPLTTLHWSETANYAQYRPPAATIVANPGQTNCPHAQSGLKNWHDASTWPNGLVPAHGSTVNIPPNTNVLLTTVDSSFVFNLISVPATSKLIFADAPISIAARGFNVTGSLLLGSETCRLRNKINITLHGSRGSTDNPWNKGIAVTGTVDMHGAQYFPTWTRLAMTAKKGDSWIFVQDIVNWQPGQTIAVTTTELKDARDWHRNEERTIVAVKRTSLHATVAAIQLNAPLDYQHFGGREYQAEVTLLSRNIIIQGDAASSPPTDTSNRICKDKNSASTYPCVDSYLTGFGAHVIVYNPAAQGRFSGVEFYRVGQTNVLGRYPLHFHLMGDITASNYANAYARDCAVHESYFRCFAIHGTQGVLLTQNTAYDAIGHCFFLEDGVEENNILSYNQAAFVHPLGYFMNPSNTEIANKDNFWGQYLDYYKETSTLILPSDMSAACFYITNTYNDFIGNAASGGWTGFAMPALPLPTKLFKHITNMSPANRPFRSPFRGNTGHSSGYWWQSAGSIYVGGELTHDSSGVLQYTAGRSSTHDTCSDTTAGTPNGEGGCWTLSEQLWLRFEDNKVFLSNRGMQNWGNRAEIINLELHDVSLAMNVFGKVWIDNMLMECRTTTNKFTYFNGCPDAPTEGTPRWTNCNVRDYTFYQTFGGFQWYDVGQQHILTDSTFRNCRADWERCTWGSSKNCINTAVFTSLTHSDQFVPELMQVSNGIKYENVGDRWRYSTSKTDSTGITVSGRLQSWYDPDGSAAETGARTMIGSAWANDWWKYNSNCVYYLEAYKCKLAAGDSSASVIVKTGYSDESQIGTNNCMNGGGSKKCPVIGQVSHFGATNESAGLSIGVNGKLTGPIIAAAGGWFIRYSNGTPKKLTLISVQVAMSDIFLVAIPYPSGTTFNIYFNGASWCGTSWAYCKHDIVAGNSIAAVRNAFGDVYYWDNTNRVLYLRLIVSKSTFGDLRTNNTARWTPYQPEEQFTRGGQTLITPSYQSSVIIEASCASNPCDPSQTSSVKVPNPVPITVSTTTGSAATTKAATTTTASATTATTKSATTASATTTTTKSATTASATTATTKSATTAATTASSTTKASTTGASSNGGVATTGVDDTNSTDPTATPGNTTSLTPGGNTADGVKDGSGAMVSPNLVVVLLLVSAILALLQ